MFVYNLKLNSSFFYKILLGIIILIVIVLCGIVGYKIYKESIKLNDDIPASDVTTLTAQNYTNVLKTVHSDLDTYVGKKIQFTGFVYRLYDFSNEQFVLGRQMIVSSDMQAVVVGFLCHLNGADKYKDGCWVEIEGTITKGEYHGAIPVIEIEGIKEVKTPSDEYVYPPEETYIPTSATL